MTDISAKFSWDSVIVLEDWVNPNRYECKVYFDIETDSGTEQNIAFERCQIFVDAVLQNSVIINLNNPLLPMFAKKTKQKMVTIPNEPLDVILAAVIFNKFNSICEGRLIINEVELSSSQGEHICIHFDHEFNEAFTQLDHEIFKQLNETAWWFREDASSSDWFEQTKKEIKFHKHKAEWEKDLSWEQKDTDDKNAKWKPTVIHGGKTQH